MPILRFLAFVAFTAFSAVKAVVRETLEPTYPSLSLLFMFGAGAAAGRGAPDWLIATFVAGVIAACALGWWLDGRNGDD